MKVVVLARDSTSTWTLVNALRIDYPDLKVALERRVPRWLLLSRRLKRVGIWTVFGQVLFILYVRGLRLLTRKRINLMISHAGLRNERPGGLVAYEFESVNSKQCIDWLVTESPDVVVINGTRIVSPAVLGACSAVFLNTHCGITPTYRGVHGGYWALYQGDRGHAGVTVHVVDPGIDSGDIVYQATIEVDEHDDVLTYPVKQYIAGIPLMRQALADVAAGCLMTTQRTDLPSALWQHPTLWQYVWARWTRGVR